MYSDCNKLCGRIIVKCGMKERYKNCGAAKAGFHNHCTEIFLCQ
jgi:hypothetical protein